MKKSIYLLSYFLLINYYGFTQVKVYPLNKVHIGPIWSSSFLGTNDEALYLNGGVNITCLPATQYAKLTLQVLK